MRARKFLLLLLCVLMVLSAPICASAQDSSGSTEVTNERKYDPLDLVVVLDASGSMTSSDPKRTAISAVRMLVNMMPADSRVAVISFNTKPTVKTIGSGGKPALISLEEFGNVETVRDAVDSIVYKGQTGIGNAVKAATDLLAEQGMPGRTKAVMVFTDGVNKFSGPLGVQELATCEGNEVDAIQWAKENDTVIYCVGYNYKDSMGKNGEGLQKLTNIANLTGGKVRSISKASEIQPLLVEFLADVCDLVYVPVGTIPGDGEFHECRIPVSPSVVEANIRIAGGNANSIKTGEIKLYDPSGNEVKLQNSGNVRFDVDVNAASIKVILPKPGEWLLTVNGIEGEDIHIGLLEHFKMNLTSTLVFPEGNPTGVAYSNDVIGVRCWLTYDGAELTDAALYDAVTSATATFVSRANPEDQQVVTLTRDGMGFSGSFRIPADSYYDVLVRLDWDTVYREDTLTVKSNNKPPELKKDLEDVKVNKGKTVMVTDIYQCVYDDEGDAITAGIYNSTSPDVADVTLDANTGTITITGKKWAATLVTVQYKDNMGNIVETTFEVQVNDPVTLALIIGALVLITLAILLAVWWSYESTLKIKGDLYLGSIEFDTTGDDDGDFVVLNFTEDLDNVQTDPNAIMLPMRSFYRKRSNRNMDAVLTQIKEVFRFAEDDTPGAIAREFWNKNTVRTLFTGIAYTKIRGSVTGGSFNIKVGRKTLFLKINHSDNVTAENESVLTFEFKDRRREGKTTNNKVTIVMKFITPVRAGNRGKGRR